MATGLSRKFKKMHELSQASLVRLILINKRMLIQQSFLHWVHNKRQKKQLSMVCTLVDL